VKPSTASAPQRVILNCDTANEIDDQFAIAYALGSPSLDVLGVVSVQNTIVHGHSSVDQYVEEARRVASLSGREDLPCPPGAASPLEDRGTPVNSEGLEFMIEHAREEPVTILATGPATDIASLALVAPELEDRVEVIWAGGFPDPETWEREKFGELNARADIQSWRAVTESSLPLRVLPGWPGVSTVTVEAHACIERLRGIGQPACDYLADIFAEYVENSASQYFDMDSGGRATKVLWDIVNVAAVTRPESVSWTTEQLPRVDPAGYPDWTNPVRQAAVGLEVDASLVLEDLWTSLQRLPQGE
jgi:inosine-uridine nucleoside N-ribohydrolase